MLINKDFSYISEGNKKLINMGYGELGVNSITFDRYYTDEEKANNKKLADTMNNIEWNKHCEKIQKNFGIIFNEIVEKFVNSKYDIHQITKDTSSMEHYSSDWDLYFYSNKGWNNTEYMDFFRLDFNKKRIAEENLLLLEELIKFIKELEYKNICCRIQYTFIPNKEKIYIKYTELCESLQDKFIEFSGIVGKIKVVGEIEDNKEYGFFKKGSRKKYYLIAQENLILSQC